jgi:hypothetical protein
VSVSAGISRIRYRSLINLDFPCPFLNPVSSEQTPEQFDRSVSAIKDTLTYLMDATVLTDKISYLPEVANRLLQALTIQDVSIRLFSQ